MNFQALFQPQAIAIIGASSREKTVGNDVVKNLVNQGYAGKIYPINPKIDSFDISGIIISVNSLIIAIVPPG